MGGSFGLRGIIIALGFRIRVGVRVIIASGWLWLPHALTPK